MGQTCDQPIKKATVPSFSQISQFREENRSSPFERLQSSSTFKENISRSRLQVRSSRLEAIPENIDDGVRERLKGLPSLHRTERRTNNIRNIYISNLNAHYEGEVEGEQPNGEGFLKFKNGDLLQGTFKDGLCEGRGRIIRTDGSYYEGQFRSNIANGFGTYIDKSGFSCSGQWRHNSLTGKGEASYPDGSRYNGDFLNNKRHGKGVLMFDGYIFEGEFQNDQMSGFGTMRTDSGEYYSGEWKNNEKNGEGEYTWPNGNHYQGGYKNGLRDGFGKMLYGNGEEYQGHWEAGLKHGQGKYMSSRLVTKGQWQKGQFVRELQKTLR